MTREELAKIINKSPRTLTNWEKENPELVRLINQGLALDQTIEEMEKHLEKLKTIQEKANSGKFQLK